MQTEQHYLGLDIGSVSISMVVMDASRQIVYRNYVLHHGNISQCLTTELHKIDLATICQVGYNHNASDFFQAGTSVNDLVALIDGVNFLKQHIQSVFQIGGEIFGLILFDQKKRYQKYISNSSCAAGTGAFLDQQAERLGLENSAELSHLAESFQGEPPKIATRCAVFAKTDLIHCQQQGYSIPAICAGLCKGLAHNILDTLVKGIELQEPVAVVGGVSQNKKVMHYLAELTKCDLQIPDDALFIGAIGCALIARQQAKEANKFSIESLLKKQTPNKHYFFPPLSSEQTFFPDFADHQHYVTQDVEVDVYALTGKKGILPVYLGIDIGSTSTKAIVMHAEPHVDQILVGLYTRTMGQPIKATQSLLRTLQEIEEQYDIHFDFQGVGTTGSGRKFIQKVIHADLAIDEITAHARAAYALNPAVDTIIEIGGQDAKFTVMKEGRVTFSVMNYVCAAGTGSFIEEQAKRLHVSLDEYAARAVGSPAPLTSDRCTVFMERDLNHFLSQGYSCEELLAAVLHSVRDNYLSKVAHLNKIGNVICFQGATAKNQALVMAFEQKLKKPIFVSRYCHLTGALGSCLLLQEQQLRRSTFRGISFYKETLAVTDDVCDGCKNHCKLKRIKISDETIIWGYLCGRDETNGTLSSRKSTGFDLLSSRRRIFNPQRSLTLKAIEPSQDAATSLIDELKNMEFDISLQKIKQSVELNLLDLRHKLFTIQKEEIQESKKRNQIKIGIPNTLYLLEYMPLWTYFFRELGYTVLMSPPDPEFIKRGKEIAGSEFCAPISYWHGHVQWLSDKADYLFLPQMFQDRENNDPKLFCYYSNYAVSLVQNIESLHLTNRCLSPIIDFNKAAIDNVQQIYDSLPQELRFVQTPSELQHAYQKAWQWFMEQKKQLVEIFSDQLKVTRDISIVLIGRPYLILDAGMNKNIPRKFDELGVKAFFQDMLPRISINHDLPGKEFVDWNHWKFGAQILEAAEYIGQTTGIYPVFLTAFKCSPDSFVLIYVKEIMDSYNKPYLVLQLDEHGSEVGYETRIEAAIRSFRNHFNEKSSRRMPPIGNRVLRTVDKEGTILIPNYDEYSCSLIAAAFRHRGYHTCLIEETATTVISSLRLNDGQCLPISAIAQGAVETIQKHGLNPSNTAIFLNAIVRTACNFPQYPLMAKKMLEQRGDGFERVQIFATEFDLRGFSLELIYDIYCAYLLGGLLRRIGCNIRPYEIIPGQTNAVLKNASARLYRCFAFGESKEMAFKEIVAELQEIPVAGTEVRRPRVTIIGDLYVRDNDVFNQQLIEELENYGAEVVTTPFNYIIRLLAIKHKHFLWADGKYLSLLRDALLFDVMEKFEKRFFNIANEILHEKFPTFDDALYEHLKAYNLSLQHGGETAQNVMKVFSLMEHYPDIRLIVHVNPIFCCPGMVSESIFKKVEKDIGIPIVSIIYDGTTTRRNEILAPYLHYIKEPDRSMVEMEK